MLRLHPSTGTRAGALRSSLRQQPPEPGVSLNGNATSTYRNVALLSVSSVIGPLVTTSVEIERRLEPILRRLRLPVGLLERVAGVVERRNWGPNQSSHEASVQAGKTALAEAGIA